MPPAARLHRSLGSRHVVGEGYEVRVQLTRHERGALACRRLREAAQVKSTACGCVCAGISHGRVPACNAIDGYAQAREQAAVRQIGGGRPVECVGHDPCLSGVDLTD